jgi:DNA-binding CsgD family transcriptional regulator
MVSGDAFAIFDSLTDRQHETLMLAAKHLTSKQIAQTLGLAPVTIDKRVESVRARLGSIARADLLRLYGEWSAAYGQTIDGPIILDDAPLERAERLQQPADLALAFEDSLAFDARASWERQTVWLQPGMKPSDLGVGGKLLAMLIGAVAIMAVAVLCVAFVDALMSMLQR